MLTDTPVTSSSQDTEEDVLLEAMSLLHANGAESDRTEARTRQLAAALQVQARADLGWSWSDITFSPNGRSRRTTAKPDALLLNRVMAVDGVIDELQDRTLSLPDARERLRSAAALPPANVFLFAAACVVGACGLAVVFGARHPMTYLLIAICSGGTAFVRRGLGRLGVNAIGQALVAGLLAGLCGAASAALGVNSPLGLAAVCPCLILVPGPHLLKGAMDLATSRIPLGLSRLVFAALLIGALTAGLIVGLWLGGAQLVADPPGREIPLWLDAPTAGFLAVAYGVFYSAPLRILYWPFLVGMSAHALRWIVVDTWPTHAWIGAFLACLLAGIVLIPVSRHFRIPFAAVGFASVVALVPGLPVMRTLAGLAQISSTTGEAAQQLLTESASNGFSALVTVLSMAAGFLVATFIWSRIPGFTNEGATR